MANKERLHTEAQLFLASDHVCGRCPRTENVAEETKQLEEVCSRVEAYYGLPKKACLHFIFLAHEFLGLYLAEGE